MAHRHILRHCDSAGNSYNLCADTDDAAGESTLDPMSDMVEKDQLKPAHGLGPLLEEWMDCRNRCRIIGMAEERSGRLATHSS